MDHPGTSSIRATSTLQNPEAVSSLSPLTIQQFLTQAATQLINFHPYRYREELETLLQRTGLRIQASRVSLLLLQQDAIYQSFHWADEDSDRAKLPEQQMLPWWLESLGTRQVQLWLTEQLKPARLQNDLEAVGIEWGVLVGLWQDGVIRGLLRVEMARSATAVKPIVVLVSNLAPILNQLLTQLADQRRQIALQTGYHLLRSRPEKENLIAGILNQLNHLLGYRHVHIYLTENSAEPHLALVPFGTNSQTLFQQQRATIALDGQMINLVQQTAVRRKTIVQNRIQQSNQSPPVPLQPLMKAAIGIPLLSDNTLQGVLQIQHTSQNQFSSAEVQTLEIIAEQLANSLRNIEHRKQQQHKQLERDVLVRIAKLCAEPPSEDDLIAEITAVVHDALQYDTFGVWLVDDPAVGNLRSHPSFRTLVGSQGVLNIIGPGEGMSHHVLRHKEPYRTANVQEEPAFLRQNTLIQSKLLVPILLGGSVIGLLDAESIQPDAFSEEDEAFLVAIAKLLSIAFERLRLADRSSRFQQERLAISETADLVVNNERKESLLLALISQAQELLAADGCRLYVADQQQWLTCVAQTATTAQQGKPAIPVGEGPIGRMLLNPQPQSLRLPKGIDGDSQQPEAILLAPMLQNGKVIGVLAAERQQHRLPFTESDLSLLTALAKQGAIAVENRLLLEQKEQHLQLLELLKEAACLEWSNGDLTMLTAQFVTLVNEGDYFNGRFTLLLHAPETEQFRLIQKSGSRLIEPEGPVLKALEATSIQHLVDFPHKTIDEQEVRSALYMPIRAQSGLLGLAILDHAEAHHFSDLVEEQFGLLVEQIAILILNHQARQEVQALVLQQQTMTEFGQMLLKSQSYGTIWQTAVPFLDKLFGTGQTAVFLPQPTLQSWPVPSRFSQRLQAIYEDKAIGWLLDDLLRKSRATVLNQIESSTLDKSLRAAFAERNINQLAIFPLSPSPSTFLGCLIVEQEADLPFEAERQQLASQAAQMVGDTLAQQHERLTALATLKQETLLNQIFSTLMEHNDIPTILATAIRLTVEMVNADSGVIGLMIDQQVLTYYPYNLPLTINLAPSTRKANLDWHVMDTLESMLISTYREHALVQAHGWQQAELYGAIAVPIVEEIDSLGLLKLFRHAPERPFSSHDLNLVQKIGRQAGIAIKKAHQHAEFLQRIENLTTTLAKQEALDQKRGRFVQNVSHELRTPLGIIMGYAELLENGSLGNLAEAHQEPIQIISRRVRMLNQLVNDLSTLLAAETQEFRRDPISITQLIEALVAEFRIKAAQASITLETEIGEKLPWVMGDVNHLRRVFDNLLSNAFKFTPENGTIVIRAWREAYDVCIEVADSGRGMSQTDLSRIFERFFQVAGGKHAPKSKGTGLGLSLVKEIISAHRGKVTVDSEEGKGTAFIIRLPGYDWDGLE